MDAIERVFREEYGRVIATLIRDLRDIDLAPPQAWRAFLERRLAELDR